MKTAKNIIIDTDIGTNADDLITLVLALNSPEINILGVTTVYTDSLLRAKIGHYVLNLLNRSDIPIYAGMSESLYNNRPVESPDRPIFKDFYSDDFSNMCDAVSFIINTILENPYEITLVAIGPLTNIASAIIKEPKIVPYIKEIVMMGGVTHLSVIKDILPLCEHNVSSDPEAASVVCSSGIPIAMFGLDITYQINIDNSHIQELIDTNKPVNLLIATMLKKWMLLTKRDVSFLCDPLTIVYLISPNLLKGENVDIHVEYNKTHPSGQTIPIINKNSNIKVYLDIDKNGTIDFIMKRLL